MLDENNKNDEKYQAMQKVADEKKKLIVTNQKWEDIIGQSSDFIDNLYEVYEHPTRIQSYSLRRIFDKEKKNFNFLIKSVNGSGKTLIFTLPALFIINPTSNVVQQEQITNKKQVEQGKDETQSDIIQIYYPESIIICENDLQVHQIHQYIKEFIPQSWKDMGYTNVINYLYGQSKLEFKGQILVTTVHLLYSLALNKNKNLIKINLNNLKFIAIDQCDAIFKSNKDDIIPIISQIIDLRQQKDKQGQERDIRLVATSATWDKQTQYEISNLLIKTLKIGFSVKVDKVNVLHGVSQYYYQLKQDEKADTFVSQVILEIINRKINTQIIVFVNNKKEAKDLTKDMNILLKQKNISAMRCDFMSSEITQNKQRVEKLNKFKKQEFQIMFATNIMARGIDIRTVGLVINLDVPREKAYGQINHTIYLHRIARTGRFIDMGVALTIFNPINKKMQHQDDLLIDLVKKNYQQEIKQFTNFEDFGNEITVALKINQQHNIKKEEDPHEKEEINEEEDPHEKEEINEEDSQEEKND